MLKLDNLHNKMTETLPQINSQIGSNNRNSLMVNGKVPADAFNHTFFNTSASDIEQDISIDKVSLEERNIANAFKQ